MISLRHFFAALPLSLLFVLTASAVSFESGVETGTLKAYTIESEHFQIEFSPLVKDQVDSDGDGVSDIVETVAEALEDSWDFVIEDLGYESPVDFSSGKILAVIDDNDDYLYEGTVGVAGVFSNGVPYLAVDAWAPEGVMRVTMVHEFYHVVQFGMNLEFSSYSQGVNLAESTAVWIEDLVYDEVNDYVNYINDFLDYPDYSIFAAVLPEGSLYEYGLGMWPRFLYEYFEDEAVLREVWEEYAGSSRDVSHHLKVFEAYEEALEERGEDLTDLYQEFMLWNLDLDQYEEGSLYPEVLALLDPVQGEYTSIDENYAPALFGSNYLYFENDESEDEFYFNIVKAEGVSYAVSLVPYDGRNVNMQDAETYFIAKNDEWEGASLNSLSAGQAVIALVSPLEANFTGLSEEAAEGIFDQAHLYYYFAGYGADASSLGGSADVEVEEVNEEKEGEMSLLEESADTRTLDDLVLSVLSFDEDSVTFEWNRPNWTDLDSYQLWYGTNVEYSDDYITIDQAFVRFETVDGLSEDVTYYFQLVPLDEYGNELDGASNLIAVTPQAELFTDLGHLDEHHDAVSALVDEGVFQGYSDGTFRPDDEINRAEFLKILIEGRGLIFDPSDYQNCFSDVSDQWYAHYVCYAYNQSWVMGYSDGTFKPGNTISKVEALKILFQVYEEELVPEGTFIAGIQYKDVKPRAWYSVYVGHAQNLGILEEEWGALFEPSALRTRGEIAEQLYRYLVTQDYIERY